MNSPGHDDDALWSAYLDGTLDAAARARAEARLRASAADREALEAMRAAEERLRAMPVPDPGTAYWRDFAARVEARVEPRDPARVYEKLAAWFLNGERVRWMRAAGVLAGLTLVTYIGMRGFRPSEVGLRSTPSPVEIEPPPVLTTSPAPERDASLPDAPPEVAEGQPTKPRGSGASPGASRPLADRDDAASKVEAKAPRPSSPVPQPPAPQASYDFIPKDKARSEEVAQELKPAPRTFAIEPQEERGVGKLTTEREALSLDVRGGRGSSATDSIASLLARSLRLDSSESSRWAAAREAVKTLNQSKRASEALRLPSAAPQPTAEVDRLLQLADTAEPYATDPAIRPHVETIALRLAEFARADSRAATRARALMRNLAATSHSPRDRAQWEERSRQLPN